MKTIAVFGGNGRTGLEILRQALDKGYKVKALVRNPASFNIQHERLEVLQGTPMKKEDVEMTIKGADTVFVALNIARTADNPWAKVKSPPDLLKVSMTHIVESMKKHGISRVLTVSAWGAGDSYREANWMFRFLINKTNVGIAYKGHEEQEKVLKNSGLNWTAVRPVGLTNSQASKPTRVSIGGSKKLKMAISRKDVARFMLETLDDKAYFQAAPSISND